MNCSPLKSIENQNRLMKEYLEQHKLMHKSGFFGGQTCLSYAEPLQRLVKQRNPTSLLDYGCGKGDQYFVNRLHERLNCPMPTLYDPCYDPFKQKPEGSFSGVICTDVLEHVPEDDIEDVVREIFSFATDFVFIGVSVRPAAKILPNGENCHATIRPIDWWVNKILKLKPNNIKIFIYYEDPKTGKFIEAYED